MVKIFRINEAAENADGTRHWGIQQNSIVGRGQTYSCEVQLPDTATINEASENGTTYLPRKCSLVSRSKGNRTVHEIKPVGEELDEKIVLVSRIGTQDEVLLRLLSSRGAEIIHVQGEASHDLIPTPRKQVQHLIVRFADEKAFVILAYRDKTRLARNVPSSAERVSWLGNKPLSVSDCQKLLAADPEK